MDSLDYLTNLQFFTINQLSVLESEDEFMLSSLSALASQTAFDGYSNIASLQDNTHKP